MVTRRTPCSVDRSPDNRGFKVGLSRTQGRNASAPAPARQLRCKLRARASTESLTLPASTVAAMSSRAACASQDPTTAAQGAKSRDRHGVPCDESQCDQQRVINTAIPDGRKAGGGSQSAAGGHGGEGGGISAHRSSGTVNCAPEASGPSPAGSSPSGCFVRLGSERELTPAAEWSSEPPPASR
jgi:hypothetical protein